jgi:hypothetical protein
LSRFEAYENFAVEEAEFKKAHARIMEITPRIK